MIKTHLIPWQHEAIIVTILTERELTREEKRQVCNAYTKKTPPWGPYKSVTQLKEELKKEGFSYLASLIIVPR